MYTVTNNKPEQKIQDIGNYACTRDGFEKVAKYIGGKQSATNSVIVQTYIFDKDSLNYFQWIVKSLRI